MNQKHPQRAIDPRAIQVSRQAMLVGGRPLPSRQVQTGGQGPSADSQALFHWIPQRMLAELLDVSERTLERMRAEGSGPRFSKAGRRVLYRLADVEEWLETNNFASTVEARQKQGVTV